jgi:hypothetical protein
MPSAATCSPSLTVRLLDTLIRRDLSPPDRSLLPPITRDPPRCAVALRSRGMIRSFSSQQPSCPLLPSVLCLSRLRCEMQSSQSYGPVPIQQGSDISACLVLHWKPIILSAAERKLCTKLKKAAESAACGALAVHYHVCPMRGRLCGWQRPAMLKACELEMARELGGVMDMVLPSHKSHNVTFPLRISPLTARHRRRPLPGSRPPRTSHQRYA